MVMRIWHLQNDSGFWYAVNQFGGFSRFNTQARAERFVEDHISRYASKWDTKQLHGIERG